MPGHRRTPVMADDDGLLLAERCDQSDHVADRIEDRVGADIGWRAGPAEAAHVGGDDMEAGLGQRRDLVPPGVGQFRPAMAEHHQWPLALFEQEQLDPVGGNGARRWHRVSALFAGSVRARFCCRSTIGAFAQPRQSIGVGQAEKPPLFAILPTVRTPLSGHHRWLRVSNFPHVTRSRGTALARPDGSCRGARGRLGAGSSTPPTTACRAPRRRRPASTAMRRPRS